MTAAELRELAGALNYQSWSEWRTEDENKFAQAAEVIELIAWVEEVKPMLGLYGDRWGISLGRRHSISSSSFIDTLRRAREAAR